jgi:hypothetical protein
LVDDELGASQVVFVVPHVAAFELVPFDFFEVEAPYHWCHHADKDVVDAVALSDMDVDSQSTIIMLMV